MKWEAFVLLIMSTFQHDKRLFLETAWLSHTASPALVASISLGSPPQFKRLGTPRSPCGFHLTRPEMEVGLIFVGDAGGAQAKAEVQASRLQIKHKMEHIFRSATPFKIKRPHPMLLNKQG